MSETVIERKPQITQLKDFLKEIDFDFVTPLSHKVNIDEYADKIYSLAEIIAEWDGEELAGISVFYCNDENSLTAYESLLGVKKKFRGKGLGETLMKKTLDLVKNKGFKKIYLYTEHPHAFLLYKKLGFEITADFLNGRKQLEKELD